MRLDSNIQLTSMIKSIKETIIPAIDTGNKLALEQAHLVLGMLTLLMQRDDLRYRYDCDELLRLKALSEGIQAQIRGGESTRAALNKLALAASYGAGVLDRARAEPAELVNAVRSLRAGISSVIQAVFTDGEPESKEAMRERVLANAKAQLLRERSWVIMQGWEVDPGQVPPIESLIRNVG